MRIVVLSLVLSVLVICSSLCFALDVEKDVNVNVNEVTVQETPQKTLDELSLTELKAVMYDLLAQQQLLQKDMQTVNDLIQKNGKSK